MSLVATLICNPDNPALDSTILDGARAVLPSAGPAHWLWDEVAADIPFDMPTKSKDDIRAIADRLRARAATCRSTLSCSRSRPGARSFFWPTWIPP